MISVFLVNLFLILLIENGYIWEFKLVIDLVNIFDFIL